MPKDITSDTTIHIETGKPVTMPSGDFVANAQFIREGADLHMTSPDGQQITVEGYFAQSPAPDIVTADGAHLSPEMVDAFLPPQHAGQYADASSGTAIDISPAGQITEIVGTATITRADGTKVEAAVGTPVYPGDVVETSKEGAVNILFADNTTFAISESARLSIDQFTYSAADQEGTSFFSMLQGVFVYTSGLIGKSDPGNVNIETPVGSIGIRGTVVAGDVKPAGEETTITIVDGAAVVTTQAGSTELNDRLETATLSSYAEEPNNIGQINSSTFASNYSAVSNVVSNFNSMGSGIAPANGSNGASPTGDASQHNDAAPASDGKTQTQGTTTDAPAGQSNQAAPADGVQAQPPAEAPAQQVPTQIMAPVPTAPATGSDFGSGTSTAFGGPGDFSGTNATTGAATAAAAGTASANTVPTTVAVAPPPPPPPAGTLAGANIPGTVAGNAANVPNTAPGGTDAPVNMLEDIPRTLHVADFGFVDNNNLLKGVIIDSIPANGTLTMNGAIITAVPTFIPVSALVNGTVTFSATGANVFGANYANLTFRVVDTGGIENGGVDTDPTANTLTFNILPVNDAPIGANRTAGLTEDTARTFSPGDFTFTDVENNGFAGIVISSLPTAGQLLLNGNAVTVGLQVTVAQLGQLQFVPAANANGTGYASFTFQVMDNGGNANGGTSIDPTPKTITFDVFANNDAPELTINAPMTATVANATLLTTGMLALADVDTASTSLTYNMTSAPLHGAMQLYNGTVWFTVTAFTQADVLAGNVRYLHDGSAAPADSFTFRATDGVVLLAPATFNITIPQTPDVSFQFSNHYINNTPGDVSDDGIPLFGAGWTSGEVLGTANLTGSVAPHTFELTYQKGAGSSTTLTASGDILGYGYVDNSVSPAPYDTTGSSTVPLFHFDAATGSISLLSPLAMNGFVNGDYAFTIAARDTSTSLIIDQQSFVFQTHSFSGGLFLGTAGADGSTVGLQGSGGITLAGGNNAVFAGAGDDRVLTTGTGNYIDMGIGNDLIVVSAANGPNGFINGGSDLGIDRLVLGGTNITYDFTNGAVTGVGYSTPMAMGKVTGINVLEMGGNTVSNDVILTLKDIFEMTDSVHTLTIKTNQATGQYGNLFIDTDVFTVAGPLDLSNTTTGAGQVTMTAMYNSQSVTLIIEQGTSTDGVVVHNI